MTLCDSSGLSAIVVLYRSEVRTVRLTGMNDQVQQLLTRTGLAELLAGPRPDARDAADGSATDDGTREVG